jgi:glycosyltransferase involved in cell wall biosynthesis
MAYGAFQISTLEGEAADLLARLGVGLTVPAGDAGAMADAIGEALAQRGGPNEREHIRTQFLARYSASAIYEDLSRRIESLAGAGQPDNAAAAGADGS